MNKKHFLFSILLCMLIVCGCDKQSKKDTETPTKISAMTYNIRLDIKSDGINQWDNKHT